jgi:hypothetical protein
VIETETDDDEDTQLVTIMKYYNETESVEGNKSRKQGICQITKGFRKDDLVPVFSAVRNNK